MRLSLFSRLVIGYFAIFLLVMGASLYATLQLRRFNEVTRSILAADHRLLDYEKKLTDAFLSQIRYERKFVIAKDEALYSQFVLFKNDFDRYLEQAGSVADPGAERLLKKLRGAYRQYQELLGKELGYLKARQTYPQGWYKQEKEGIADAVLGILEELRVHSQQRTYGKVRELAEASNRASQAALLISLASLVLIIVISLFQTRGITRPISLLKKKTREIANGNLQGDLRLSSPPEMAELAGAFNFMCEQLRDLDRMKFDFFSTMSHELRTPLTSIKEGTGLLLDGVGGAVTEKQKKLLGILAEESNRLITLVNSLLDLSKMEAGMMTYHLEPGSLAPLVRRVTVELTPLVEVKQINLETRIQEELPLVRVDQERMLQVLRNLIGNAVKFTPVGGSVTISARSLDGKVEVSVQDTGPGIPPGSLESIFDKFHQAPPVAAYGSKGTGLGLAVAKHIITSHGGKIWVESQAGQGSTFVFALPC